MVEDISKKLEQLKKTIENAKLPNADKLAKKYMSILSKDYIAKYPVTEIIRDIKVIDKLSEESQYEVSLGASPSKQKQKDLWCIKLFKLNDQVSLSRGLPIIENFGFKLLEELPFKFQLNKTDVVHICDFGVIVPLEVEDKIHDKKLVGSLNDAIIAAFNRVIENDRLNQLVLFSGLSAREVSLLRAITHYCVQTTLPFSRAYMAEVLCAYPNIARNLYRLFDAKFNIKTHDLELAKKIYDEVVVELNTVTILDDDRILKAFLVIVDAMIRTNYYQTDEAGKHKDYISFKLESGKLPFLPKPIPLYEIFVYSTRFEAIHLRSGKVARGGFRWSDRREDFRTEILGLVKAQVVKNSVIVPTGSKGGFVCKKLPPIAEREAYMAEGVFCYKQFIAGLLDITDNLVAGKIIPPKDVIRYDGDDPYLVVAADKGTATFSDYANEMSQKYKFWLGDAFASGGSAGYDHKKMGITARGAWEAAKRHFRHLGVDIQNQDFTVIGIGDMAGDVFGNGMLLSKHTCLIAAFNHLHIFLDPNPDPESSFAERLRMFNLPRSGWADYDKSKISQGGGIFERSAKSIQLSPEIKAWLGTTEDEMSPNDLIHNILQAKADLLYNGGIGTYVKAESESHEAVKDKANDYTRVNGKELKVRVVVEGGNLGVTQLGRIEFAKIGGFICTDAIDNSAGVDCSDHEVNIKILFADIMQKTKMTLDERNVILEQMTDNVASLVLRDNYLQTQVLSYARARSEELFSININFIDKFEKRGEINRSVEFLPSHQEIIERQRTGTALTVPELAVLLAYSKMSIDAEVIKSDLVCDSTFDSLLVSYFPKFLQDNYSEYIYKHYLRKEIIANQIANLIVNQMGITFVSRFEDEFRCDISVIVRAFWAAYQIFGIRDLCLEIESLDNKVNADIQVEMFIRVKKTMERTIRWIMRRFKQKDELNGLVQKYSKDVHKLLECLPIILHSKHSQEISDLESYYVNAGVPKKLAELMARSGAVPQLLDIAFLSNATEHKLLDVAVNYFYLGHTLRMDWLRKNLIALPENNKWQSLSRSALLADGFALYSNFIKNAIESTSPGDNRFGETWIKKEPVKIKQINDMIDELQTYKNLDLSMLSAVVRELHSILG
ncbi:MAG: glutamate dehydrogenase [Pseudomonadota bacterium]|nr:glutamate dehydrogenase [Pseudomonadota bacterium]